MKAYHHIAKAEDGRIYEYRCEKYPNGQYKLDTMERHEITDEKYIKWYNRTHKD